MAQARPVVGCLADDRRGGPGPRRVFDRGGAFSRAQPGAGGAEPEEAGAGLALALTDRPRDLRERAVGLAAPSEAAVGQHVDHVGLAVPLPQRARAGTGTQGGRGAQRRAGLQIPREALQPAADGGLQAAPGLLLNAVGQSPADAAPGGVAG